VVVAAADLDGLEKPVAYVLLHEGTSAEEDELIAFCREGLPSFKRPRKVVFVDAYPTTATGKIRRVELRAMAATALVEAPVEKPVGGLHWQREDNPRWDSHKQSVFGPTELASVGLSAPRPGAAIADEWWQVVDDAGTILGYGWLDSEWGDAQISFLVAPDHRGAGIGAFVVDRLEDEARRRGLNYIYNVVPAAHPDRAWMTNWLESHGFVDSGHDLRRQVRAAARQ
jgi:GNAT superfamily N-acetyltransferase